MIAKELTFLSSYCMMLDEHHRSVADFILSCGVLPKSTLMEKTTQKKTDIISSVSSLIFIIGRTFTLISSPSSLIRTVIMVANT